MKQAVASVQVFLQCKRADSVFDTLFARANNVRTEFDLEDSRRFVPLVNDVRQSASLEPGPDLGWGSKPRHEPWAASLEGRHQAFQLKNNYFSDCRH